MTDHLIRWAVLSLAGAAWLVLIPHDAFGEAPRLASGTPGLTPVEMVGAGVLALAWLGFLGRVVQRFGVWRSDAACVVLFVITVSAAAIAVASAVIGNVGWLVAALVAMVAAQSILALRIDRLRDGLKLRFPGLRPSVRGTPPAP